MKKIDKLIEEGITDWVKKNPGKTLGGLGALAGAGLGAYHLMNGGDASEVSTGGGSTPAPTPATPASATPTPTPATPAPAAPAVDYKDAAHFSDDIYATNDVPEVTLKPGEATQRALMAQAKEIYDKSASDKLLDSVRSGIKDTGIPDLVHNIGQKFSNFHIGDMFKMPSLPEAYNPVTLAQPAEMNSAGVTSADIGQQYQLGLDKAEIANLEDKFRSMGMDPTAFGGNTQEMLKYLAQHGDPEAHKLYAEYQQRYGSASYPGFHK